MNDPIDREQIAKNHYKDNLEKLIGQYFYMFIGFVTTTILMLSFQPGTAAVIFLGILGLSYLFGKRSLDRDYQKTFNREPPAD